MVDRTTTALLAKLKRRGWLADGQVTTSDDDLLAIASSEIALDIAPLLKAANEDYLLRSETITVSAGSTYALPARALAGGFRALYRVDGGSLVRLTRYGERLEGLSGTTHGFFLEGSTVNFVPANGGTFRLVYQLSPGELTTTFATVTSVGATSITAALPTDWSGALTVDIQAGTPGFEPRGLSLACTASAGTTLTFAAGVIPSTVVAGDQVAFEGTVAIPECPVEVHEYLALRAAAVLAASTGAPNAGNLVNLASDARDKVGALLSPRTPGHPKPVVPRYGPGRRYW